MHCKQCALTRPQQLSSAAMSLQLQLRTRVHGAMRGLADHDQPVLKL